jgi:hypothetical protein
MHSLSSVFRAPVHWKSGRVCTGKRSGSCGDAGTKLHGARDFSAQGIAKPCACGTALLPFRRECRPSEAVPAVLHTVIPTSSQACPPVIPSFHNRGPCRPRSCPCAAAVLCRRPRTGRSGRDCARQCARRSEESVEPSWSRISARPGADLGVGVQRLRHRG